jgi:ribosomal protein S18 acetylase RimI-like enzyme
VLAGLALMAVASLGFGFAGDAWTLGISRLAQGFGSALYRELHQRARRAGYQRFVLDTGARNDTARGFYEGLGFECVRELSVDYRDQSLDLALYQKPITE